MYAILGNLSGQVETSIPNLVYARITTIVDHKYITKTILCENLVLPNVYNLPIYIVNIDNKWKVYSLSYTP